MIGNGGTESPGGNGSAGGWDALWQRLVAGAGGPAGFDGPHWPRPPVMLLPVQWMPWLPWFGCRVPVVYPGTPLQPWSAGRRCRSAWSNATDPDQSQFDRVLRWLFQSDGGMPTVVPPAPWFGCMSALPCLPCGREMRSAQSLDWMLRWLHQPSGGVQS
jgi:hypothetical protein